MSIISDSLFVSTSKPSTFVLSRGVSLNSSGAAFVLSVFISLTLCCADPFFYEYAVFRDLKNEVLDKGINTPEDIPSQEAEFDPEIIKFQVSFEVFLTV